MIFRFRQLLTFIALVLLGSSLAGCASLNERASATMGDYIPQWAGGLPPDAPPRPGTVKYDEWMKERERQRQLPADQRPPDPNAQASSKPFAWNPSQDNSKPAPKTKPSTTSTTPAASSASTPSGLDPVH